MPFGKQEGGERTDGKGSEVKFVRFDLAQQLAINCDVLKFHRIKKAYLRFVFRFANREGKWIA